ncbi:MAG TPA: nuclear transport factor 2 family protein [Pyrinomonadaceae bacterium]|nr:nuclear transport factor 2 family protein [Pyrinomonadaceae bacterium]
MNSGSTENSKSLNDAGVVELLSNIEAQLAAAWVAGDHSFHERILADDWSVIDATGRVLSKSEVLAEAFSGDRQITTGHIDEINVRPFGDWAIVTGRTHMSGRYRGEEMDVMRFTRILMTRD